MLRIRLNNREKILISALALGSLWLGRNIYYGISVDPKAVIDPESEGRSWIGVINRAQQAYYTENQKFATSLKDLELSEYYHTFNNYTIQILSGKLSGLAIAKGTDNEKNKTRDYIGGISYNPQSDTFKMVVCRANHELKENNYNIVNPSEAIIINYGIVEAGIIECANGVSLVR